MLKRKLAGVIVAGLLLGAGAAQAGESPFPYSVQEVPAAWYADRIPDRVIQSASGPSSSTFPSSVADAGPNYVVRPEATRAVSHAAVSNIQARVTVSPFPSSVSETGPNRHLTPSAA
jgi:hypothetical protein